MKASARAVAIIAAMALSPASVATAQDSADEAKDVDENKALTGSHPQPFPLAEKTRIVPLGREDPGDADEGSGKSR